MSELERDAFAALVRQLDDDPLEAETRPMPVAAATWTETAGGRRAGRHLSAPTARAAWKNSTRRLRRGVPLLRRDRAQDLDRRRAARQLTAGAHSRRRARRDQQARREQERLRSSPTSTGASRRRVERKHAGCGLAARLAHGPAALYRGRRSATGCASASTATRSPTRPNRSGRGTVMAAQ